MEMREKRTIELQDKTTETIKFEQEKTDLKQTNKKPKRNHIPQGPFETITKDLPAIHVTKFLKEEKNAVIKKYI